MVRAVEREPSAAILFVNRRCGGGEGAAENGFPAAPPGESLLGVLFSGEGGDRCVCRLYAMPALVQKRCRNAAKWARVAVPPGFRAPFPVPWTIPFPTAQPMASRA